MLQDITLGQYFPGNSILHRLDARVKIGLLFILMILIFFIESSAAYAILTLLLTFLIGLSNISPIIILKSLKPLIWIVLFTFGIHLFSHDGEVLFEFIAFTATDIGLKKGAAISLRLILLILFSSLLTFTTSPIMLTDAVEKMLSPLKKFGVPAHEFDNNVEDAYSEEMDKIIKAQSARGVDFESGNLIKRAKSFVPILVPLFLSAFRRADELAMAMEARCYRGGEGRSQLKKLQIQSVDYIAVIIFFFISLLTLYANAWQ